MFQCFIGQFISSLPSESIFSAIPGPRNLRGTAGKGKAASFGYNVAACQMKATCCSSTESLPWGLWSRGPGLNEKSPGRTSDHAARADERIVASGSAGSAAKTLSGTGLDVE